jgi:hypothetical protein
VRSKGTSKQEWKKAPQQQEKMEVGEETTVQE